MDGPKERTVPEFLSGKGTEQITTGNARSKLVDGLPETNRFIREKGKSAAVTVVTKNAEDMAEEYGFDERQKGLLEELLSPEYNELFDTLLRSNPALVPGDLDGVLMPGDVSETRRQIVATGSQLLGRVHYF